MNVQGKTIDMARVAMGITTTKYDRYISQQINAALRDLEIAGVKSAEKPDDDLIIQAVVTYCAAHPPMSPPDEKIMESYEMQKSQLMTATGYTEWGGGDDHS